MQSRFIYLFIGLFFLIGSIISFVLGVGLGLSASPEDYDGSIYPSLSVAGTWLGALATFSAVFVSLWLALKQLNQDKEILDCRLEMMVIPHQQHKPCVTLSIVSKGNRPANVNSITWHGEGAPLAMTVYEFHRCSNKLPRVLSYGESILLMHVPEFESILHSFAINHLDGNFHKLYASVNTTTGSTRVKVEGNFLSRIKECQPEEHGLP